MSLTVTSSYDQFKAIRDVLAPGFLIIYSVDGANQVGNVALLDRFDSFRNQVSPGVDEATFLAENPGALKVASILFSPP